MKSFTFVVTFFDPIERPTVKPEVPMAIDLDIGGGNSKSN